jgi:hypothetical protein
LSPQAVKEPEVCFYGSANVVRANGLLSVWTKCLSKEDLNNAVKEDSTGSLSDIAAEKIAHDYVPPIARVKALEGDQIVDAVMDEELANNGNIRPLVTALREIDCAKRQARELSVIMPVDRQVRSSDTAQDWHRVPNVGDLASLSKFLCTTPPTLRSKARWASRARFAAKWASAAQLFPAVNTFKLLARADDEAKIGFKVHPHMHHHACGYELANQRIDTWGVRA